MVKFVLAPADRVLIAVVDCSHATARVRASVAGRFLERLAVVPGHTSEALAGGGRCCEEEENAKAQEECEGGELHG